MFQLLKDPGFHFKTWLESVGFTPLQEIPGKIPEKCYKMDINLTSVLYIPVYKDYIEIITDFKPSFTEDAHFYEVYDLNILQGVGDRLFHWGTYYLPQNQTFAEQLLVHHFSDVKKKKTDIFPIEVDPAFDLPAWLKEMGFKENELKMPGKETISISFDEDRLEISKGEYLLSYCLAPQNKAFAEQLFAHCLAEITPVQSIKVGEILEKIKAQYREKAPVVLKNTLSPATETEIQTLEDELGEKLPQDFRDFLLYNDLAHNFIGNYSCLSLEGILREWRGMNQLLEQGAFNDGRVEIRSDNYAKGKFQKVWWSKKWLPFCVDSCGNKRMIDFDPTQLGQKYQLLDMEIQDGMGPFTNKYHTFLHFLQIHLEYLLQNKFTIEEWGIEFY